MTKVGDKLYGDHGSLRVILDVQPDSVLVTLWDTFATDPIGKILAQGYAALGDKSIFSDAKEKAVEFIAGERGLHSQQEWDGVRRDIIWRTPEQLASQ